MFSVLETSDQGNTIVTTGDLNDLVSIDQTNHDFSRILNRNYSSSTNDSKTITPGSCVASPPLKSNLQTQDIYKLYDHYYPNIEEKENITENSVHEDLNDHENIGTRPGLSNDIRNRSHNSPEVFKFDGNFDPSQPQSQSLSEKSPLSRYQKKRGSVNTTLSKIPMKETYFIGPTNLYTSVPHEKSKGSLQKKK